ncbi:E3 ubiquitin-protein ligase SlrP [Enhygromyxa salina]|uniref:E3 ubiquitin-protein ligase SlrP n=1 Tax=Enhygromyxa salina TaxID=215803 RepID=A0A2S9YFB5_9BACT|nr:hypothetical protein [Enhygromyxa salina]PRQ03731.1 E3 ubiquitin-protein ligase SlrP [Enhygromyxa salina]
MGSSSPDERPAGVPPEAWWSADDNEWVLGPKDADGEFHGEVRYWRPDGTLCEVAQHRHGRCHGPFERFHETGERSRTGNFEDGKLHGQHTYFHASGPTTEKMHGPSLDRAVARAEFDCVHGVIVTYRYYGADGAALGGDGRPLPDRPAGVPAHAIYRCNRGDWVVGTWEMDGHRDARLEVFESDGRRSMIESLRAGRLHGPTTRFYPGGGKWAVLEYEEGELHGVCEHYRRDGSLARRAHFEAGAWAGTLTDFDAKGRVLEERTIIAPASAPTPATSLAAASGEPDDSEVSEPSAPARLARLIASGWGGDETRDADLARAARRTIREHEDPALAEALAARGAMHRAASLGLFAEGFVAKTCSTPGTAAFWLRALGENSGARRHDALHPGLLAATGLDTAPRLLTATRVRRVLTEMGAVATVDVEVLTDALGQGGGAGAAAMLTRDDARGVDALRARVVDARLNLLGQGLVVLPRAVQHLPWLDTIAARRNAIETVPPEIGHVFLLRELDLQGNRLTTLPAELGRLGELRSLSLAENHLRALPEVVPELTELVSLSVGNNEIAALPERFGQLGRLRQLGLEGNALTNLPDSFAQLTSLSFLHLGGLPWSTPPAVIYELSSLRVLWIGSPSLTHVPSAIARLTQLECLSLWSSALTELPEALFQMTTLRELRVRRNNPLPEATIDRLKEALPDCKIY